MTCFVQAPHESGIRFLRSRRQLHDSILVCADEQFLAIGDAEFIENAGEVMADRDARNAQAIGDVLVREPLADQPDDLAFSLGQAVRPLQLIGGSGD